MKLTREKLIEGIEFCLHHEHCNNGCPIHSSCTGLSSVLVQCLPYVEGKENEPASAPTETSSVVGLPTEILQTNDTPILEVCQDRIRNITKSILAMYEEFTDKEQKAFDLGEIYRQSIDLQNELEEYGYGV